MCIVTLAPFLRRSLNSSVRISQIYHHIKWHNNSVRKMSDFVEKVVCKTGDLKNNEMRVFELGEEGKVLLVKCENQFSAVGTKCTHYGAPLYKGVLHKGMIRCPWHAACFDAKTGDIEDFPGMDCIPSYEVTIENDDVKVKASKAALKKNLRLKTLVAKKPDNNTTFVIIGGGPAGLQCLETLRNEGFTGRVVLISQEDNYPYDRTKLSKSLSTKVQNLVLRQKDFFETANIEVMLNTTVQQLNDADKSLQLDNGQKLNYDKIFIASGCRPRTLIVPGGNLKNICYLRTHNDANFIAEAAADKDVVILGTSFIGMEVASFLNGKAKSITVVGKPDLPFKRVLGDVIGKRLQQLFESKGVTFRNEVGIKEFKADENNSVQEVVLSDQSVLPAQVCIIGIGAIPNVDYLKSTKVQLNSYNNIPVNDSFETNVKDVYAGGDLVTFNLPFLGDNNPVNIGHWQTAQAHGDYAAKNMLGIVRPYKSVPFFWSMLFGKGLRYAGCGQGFDDVVISGSVDDLKLIAYYLKSDKVVAIATFGRDPIASLYAAYLREGKVLTRSEIKDNSWIKNEKEAYFSDA